MGYKYFSILICVCLLLSCVNKRTEPETSDRRIPGREIHSTVEVSVSPLKSAAYLSDTRDYWPTDEWRHLTEELPESYHQQIDTLNQNIAKMQFKSYVIIQNGYILSEYYKKPYTNESLFSIYSCTKSIVSTLYGVANDKNLVPDPAAMISEVFPEVLKTDNKTQKEKISFSSVLAMTSGLDWPEWYEWNYYFRPMLQSKNWVEFILNRGMWYDPGQIFNYNSGGSHLLSAAISRRTGKSAYSFGKEEIFSQIGMNSVNWPRDPQGVSYGGHGVRMSTYDAARFGYLVLNHGKWNGTQLVSADWLVDATSQHSNGHHWYGAYGYQWWLVQVEPNVYAITAMGYGSNYIFIVPQYDLVVVFNSMVTGGESFLPMQWLRSIIVPAIKNL